ncbi:uncharacterized protein METZ01_LOCUS463202, partial [marine metagenome]
VPLWAGLRIGFGRPISLPGHNSIGRPISL